VLAAAPCPAATRELWLARLWAALAADAAGHLRRLAEHWGSLCAGPAVAAAWAERLLPGAREAVASAGSVACLASQVAAGEHEAALALLAALAIAVWPERQFGVLALAARGEVDAALAFAAASNPLGHRHAQDIARVCEAVLLAEMSAAEILIILLPAALYARSHKGVTHAMRLNPPAPRMMIFAALAGPMMALFSTALGGMWQMLITALGGESPASSIDPADMEEVFAKVRAINGTGVTILMVEQKARQCLALADYGYILDQGRNRLEGPGQALLRDPEVVRLRREAESLGIGGQVSFLGSTNQERLRLLYSAADVVLAPSYYESFGMVAVEAMACGTPVIAARVGGLQSTVKDGETGYLIPWHCGEAFAERLELLLENDGLRRQMGEAAQRSVGRFAWPLVAQQLLGVYDELLGAGSTRRTSSRGLS
jgi:hypothetical protein